MLRIACLALGLSFASMPLLLEAFADRDNVGRSIVEMRGGNPADGKGSGYCDMLSGVYTGCTAKDAACNQCSPAGDATQSSKADTLSPTAPKGATGFMEGQNPQDCGVIYTGKCVVNPASPTGFTCDGANTPDECTLGILEIVAQPVPVPAPIQPPN